MKIQLTQASPENAAELLAIYLPYVENTAISFEITPPTVEEFAARIANTIKKYPYLVARDETGRAVGYAYASPFKMREAYRYSVETSIYIAADRRGEGIGKALLSTLETDLAAMGIQNVNACIAAPRGSDPYLTDASIRFHATVGYTQVAHFHSCAYKFNRWYDMVWMEKLIGEHKELP